MSKKMKKRFIANAHCPVCKSVDTILTYYVSCKMHAECVDCGYAYDLDANKKPAVDKENIIFTSSG